MTPVQLFVASFAALIFAGTVGLEVLPGLRTGPSMGWLNALFTATSAVCVTGLIVVDTATYFTPLGQAFILLLVQLGGLGMITFASVIIVGLGGRLSLRQEELATPLADVVHHIDYRRLTRAVLRFTFVFEAIGALVLWLDWGPRLGWRSAIWHAVFNSVSAFCNAGFSTFSNSLMSFQRDPVALFVVMALIVAGGLGFLTLHEVELLRKPWRVPYQRLSLHSRLALVITAGLLVAGWLMFTVFEWRQTLGPLPAWAKVMNGLFMSVTARTAGFNTIDYAQATQITAFLTVLMMFVGGSPGGTAGGVKTTTVALIGLLAWARIRGRADVSIWGRTVPDETIHRSVGLVVAAFAIVTCAIFIFTIVALPPDPEFAGRGDFLARMFEVISAFGTVGLSTGITPHLTPAARWLTIFLMFLGRVGPLALTAVIALPFRRPGRFRFAHEDVIIG